MLCTGAQQSASNIDCWTSIVQQVTRVWRVGEIFVLKLLTTRGISADRGAADVRNRFAIILPVVITVVIIPINQRSNIIQYSYMHSFIRILSLRIMMLKF